RGLGRRAAGRRPAPDPRAKRHRRILLCRAGACRVISIRRARPTDAVAIGAVHVAAWRSAYPGILPDSYLARLSVARQAAYYDAAIRGGTGVHVATASGLDVPAGSGPRIVGYTTSGRTRLSSAVTIAGRRLGEGEIAETVTQVAGHPVPQLAFVWDPIEKLLQASPQAS